MIIPYIVFISSILIWFFPPFRQYKTEYFLFFLFLALADPIVLLLNIFLAVEPIYEYLVISFLLILALINRRKLKKNWIIIILSFLILLTAIITLPLKTMSEITILLSSIVLFIILKNSLLYFNENHTINLFFLILILYEITIIIKFIYTTSRTHSGTVYFYTISFFEVFIGIFFSFYNKENSPKFKLIKEED